MRFIIFLFVLISCGIADSSPEDFVKDLSDKRPKAERQAMQLLQNHVEKALDVDLGDLYLDAKVYYTETKCPGDTSGRNAVIFEDECYSGLFFKCNFMFVALNHEDTDKVCGTALLHEFGHCIAFDLYHNGDVNHANEVIWDLVNKINKFLCVSGV